jgi:2-phosphoglycerate kinase
MRKRILIGGASLAGKSSLAAKLSEELGWEAVATDYLARHPGRPWRDDGSDVPPHVLEHFQSLTAEELLEDVLRHYRSLAPRIREIVGGEADGLIVEGSAILPELAHELQNEMSSCFLFAKQGVLSSRIIQRAGASNEAAIKFAARAELMNEFIGEEAKARGLPVFDADNVSADAILNQP